MERELRDAVVGQDHRGIARHPAARNARRQLLLLRARLHVTFLRNINRYPPDDSRAVSHMIIVHGFDVPLANARFFEQMLERARRVADACGKRLVPVATNTREGGFRCVDFQPLRARRASRASACRSVADSTPSPFRPRTSRRICCRGARIPPSILCGPRKTSSSCTTGWEWKTVYVAQVPPFLDTLRVCGGSLGALLVALLAEVIGSSGWSRTSDPLIKSEPEDLRTDRHGDASARDSEGW
jgi:hypothetical protein